MRREQFVVIGSAAIFMIMLASCEKVEPVAPAQDKILDGLVEGVTDAQSEQHQLGDNDFNNQIFTAETGLGPIFVGTSCGSCHAGDGKGAPFTTLTRFGQTDSTGNHFLNEGGPQLQNRAIPGYEPEQIPAGATSAKFTPPIVTGLGFIETVPDSEILRFATENLSNLDGIRGHPNYNSVPSFVTPFEYSVPQAGKYICRFGKKASVYNLLQQTANAYNQDIGITSIFEPIDVYSHLPIDPEVTANTVNEVVFYLETLKAPIQRNQTDVDVVAGKQVFTTINCAGCHRPQLTTGYATIQALSNKIFSPFTDLLVHDMGPGLDDGYTEGSARTSEWRTAPLWGLGLAPNSQGGQYFLLHDGRARSIEDAILMHGGEATIIVNRFKQLSSAEQQQLIKFLESL
jgi:CxxC motif-containing protein (DUF1111 family)